MVLQMEANLGEKSLKISVAEPVGNCLKVHSFDGNRPKVCFPVVYHRWVIFQLSIKVECLSLGRETVPAK